MLGRRKVPWKRSLLQAGVSTLLRPDMAWWILQYASTGMRFLRIVAW